MAKLNFNNGVVDDYTIVLSTRDYRHVGQLTGVKGVHYSANLNSPNELSFSLMKTECSLWEQVVDLKLVWIKELNEYFEIKVSTTDSLETSKSITGTSLCEAELSQIYFSAEINTESDISRDDYEITRFYDEKHPKASLLHRVLDKVPYYKIKFVDPNLQTMQRTFSVSASTIYDFLVGECAEQFNCLFLFDSSDRSISAYDLDRYGRDTTILVDKDNLTDSIQLETNADNVKNCFKLVAGDDYMTSTIRMLNPNGSDYIYYISESQRKDMPDELTKCLKAYDQLVKDNTEQYQQLISCEKEDNLGIYQLTDKIIYLESGMMPTIEHAEVTASTEAAKLNTTNLSSLGLIDVTTSTSLDTVNSALKNYAKVYIKTGYVKLEIDPNATFEYIGLDENNRHYGTWYGRFIVSNFSNKNDVAYSDYMTITVHDNYEVFVKQKMLKAMSHDDDDNSIFDVLSIDISDEFQAALKLYCKKRLESFYDAIQSALDVLIHLDQATESADLYDTLYQPYYERLLACQTEIDVRKCQIDQLQAQLDARENARADLQRRLDFQTCLGEHYNTFLSYRREDTYSNDHYISDGLSNAEIIEKANAFIEIAQKELYKSGEQQVSISSTLYNLLTINAFKPIVDDFELGNWIRIKADGNMYTLRLLGYSIDFDNLQSLNVQFSNVTKLKDTDFQAKQVLQSAKSIATTYGYVSKQAEKGNTAYSNIQQSLQNGLNAANTLIANNVDEEVIFDKHGILCRLKDDISGQYDPKQVKLTHNALAFTDNAWRSVRQVIGEHSYSVYDKDSNSWTPKTGYGITSDFSQASQVSGCTIVGGQIYSENYSSGTNDKEASGTYIDLNDGTFSFGGGDLIYDGKNLIISSKAVGESLQEVDIKAENLHIDAANIDGTTITGKTLIGGEIRSDNYTESKETAGDGTLINLNNGEFSFGGGTLTYNNDEGLCCNQLTINSLFDENSHTKTKLTMNSAKGNYDGFSLKYFHEEAERWMTLLGIDIISSMSGVLGLSLGNIANDLTVSGHVLPYYDAFMMSTNLGSASKRWDTLYSLNGTIQASDRNLKRDIENIPEQYEQLFMSLSPVLYKFNNGTRTHLGFVAQDVEQTMNNVDISTEDFAALCKDDVNGEIQYGLRYNEFIALNTHMIQRLYNKINELEQKLNNLTNN